MAKILKLDFADDISIDEIYDELIYYKKQGIIAECHYNNVILSNENEESLKILVNILKLNMSEEQYNEHKKSEAKKEIDYKIYTTMISAPKILQYYVERGALLIEDQASKDNYIKECYYYYSSDHDYFKAIKIATILLEVLHEIKCNDDLRHGMQKLDNMMDSLSIEDDYFLSIAEILVSKTAGIDSSEIDALLLDSNAKNSKKQYEKMLKITYNKNN